MKDKKVGIHWDTWRSLLWWEIGPEELEGQVENYNTLKVTKSARGLSFLCLIVSSVITLTVILTTNIVDKSSGIIEVILFLILGFFIYKGQKWAIIVTMVLWTVEKFAWVYEALNKNNYNYSLFIHILWWCLYMHVFYIALKVENLRSKIKVSEIIWIALLFLVGYLGYTNISLIIGQDKLTKQVKDIGTKTFISEEFGYRINAPKNWKIIHREDFGKIGESAINTEAEVAMVNSVGTGVCFIIPEILQGYGNNFGLEQVRDYLVKQIKENNETHFVSDSLVSSYGNGGLELHFYQKDGVFKRDYMKLYILYGKTAISFLAFAFDQNSQKVFNEVKDIASNIQLINE